MSHASKSISARKKAAKKYLRAWNLANQDKVHAYRERHKAKMKEKRRIAREANYENLMKIRAERAARIKQMSPQIQREWRAKNPERAKAHKAKYLRTHGHIINAAKVKYRMKKAGRLHPSADGSRFKEFKLRASKMRDATGIIHVVDHIIPLSSDGWHHEDNLQVITSRMNGAAGKFNNPFWISPPEHKDWRDVPAHLWPKQLRAPYLQLIRDNRGKTLRWDTVLVPTVEAQKPTEPTTTPRFVLQHNY